jgi:hypothetical protein
MKFCLCWLDANESLDSGKSHGIQHLVDTSGMFDLQVNDSAPPTYQHAAVHRIDFIFGMEGVQQALHRSGMLSFTEGISSDHRALFVDLGVPSLLTSTPSPIVPSSTRALYSGNPAKAEKYNEEMMKYYDDHRIFKRMDWLKKQSPQMTKKQVRSRLNALDRDMGRAMVAAAACEKSALHSTP